MSSSKYSIEEDQLFIPESIYYGTQTHTPPSTQTNTHSANVAQDDAELRW